MPKISSEHGFYDKKMYGYDKDRLKYLNYWYEKKTAVISFDWVVSNFSIFIIIIHNVSPKLYCFKIVLDDKFFIKSHIRCNDENYGLD